MPAQYKDYYQTLGVAAGASQDEIRKAFRKLARQHHPDVAKDKKAAEAKFREINEAYEVLSDPEKRKRYDSLGANWDQEAFRGAASRRGGGQTEGDFSFGGTGFSDFFEQFFAGRGGRGGGAAAANPFGNYGAQQGARGGDIEADLLVTLDEALNGARKNITLRVENSHETQTYSVSIPKGVREGQKIRLAGKGQSGSRPGLEGDLLLRVRFAKHPDFRIEDDALVHDLELPAWRAVLGGEVRVPTLDGVARLKIPAGTQAGQKFRMKGRGLPDGKGGRGDFFVHIVVTLPREVSPEARAHWEALARLGDV
jgi:curved DNA-binding protein